MNWGNNLTMIGALRCEGWVTMSTMFQAANKQRFVTWVRRRLLPKLRQRLASAEEAEAIKRHNRQEDREIQQRLAG